MSGAVAAAAPSPPPPQKLDELMMAMDVVDTIRHRELLVERELDQGLRDDQLRDRLREIYKGQGIEVPDRVIDEGIKALKESRFVYVPPPPSLRVSLAMMWVHRWRIFSRVAVVLVAVLALYAAYYFIQQASEYSAESARIELAETLPKALNASYANVLRDAKADAAKTQAAQALADGKAAAARGDADGAREAIAALDAIDAKLLQTYDLRIVSDRDDDSGVIRYPDDSDTPNYYLIVEAIGSDGKRMRMSILNEETGKTRRERRWGIRVPEQTFEAVKQDKIDDGIIQNRILGHKLRGELEVKYLLPVLGGAITKW